MNKPNDRGRFVKLVGWMVNPESTRPYPFDDQCVNAGCVSLYWFDEEKVHA